MIRWLLTISILSIAVAILFFTGHQIFAGDSGIRNSLAGMVIQESPFRRPIDNPQQWRSGNYTFTPLAEYKICARILRISYHIDEREGIAPVDIALGWIPELDMSLAGNSSGDVREQIDLDELKQKRISESEIVRYGTGVRIVPGDGEIRTSLGKIAVGDIVLLEGYQIGMKKNDTLSWSGALGRTEAGKSGSDVVWVERMEIEKGETGILLLNGSY